MDDIDEKVIKIKVKTAYILLASVIGGVGSVYAVQLDHQQDISGLELKISEEVRTIDGKVDSMSGRLSLMESDLSIIKRHLLNQ